MSKGNLFLGTARGKVGDVVMYRREGKQMSRVRVRTIANPKTSNQARQRALLSTLGTAYSYMKGICDHSTQGKSKPSQNAQEFQKRNQSLARTLTGGLAEGNEEYNFNKKGESVLYCNPYAISRGTLPIVELFNPLDANNKSEGIGLGSNFFAAGFEDGTITYQDMCDELGVEKGTQITFCAIYDDNFDESTYATQNPKPYGNFHFARVILEPSTGDMTEPFVTQGGGAATEVMTINHPNAENQGNVTFRNLHNDVVGILLNGKRYPLCMGVILSNYNGQWLRSNCDMLVCEGYNGKQPIDDVIGTYMLSDFQPASDLYLNQSLPFGKREA